MSSEFSVDIVSPSGSVRRVTSQTEYREATGLWPAGWRGLAVRPHSPSASADIDAGLATAALEAECRDLTVLIYDRVRWLVAGGWPEAAADITEAYDVLPPAYQDRIARMAGCTGPAGALACLRSVAAASAQGLQQTLARDGLDYITRGPTVYQDTGGWWQVSARDAPRRVSVATQHRDALRQMAGQWQAAIDQITGIDSAMERLRPVIDRLGQDLSTLTGAEEAIYECAAAHASDARRTIGVAQAQRGSRCVVADGGQPAEQISDILRMCDPATHRRRIRTRALRGQYDASAALALVGVKSGGICADHTAAHYVDRQKRAARWASLIGVIPADADEGTAPIPLPDIQKTRRDARLASMYALTRAYADEAQLIDLLCIFGTITLPRAYHPAPKSMGGMPNPSWSADAHSAAACQELLGKIYRALIRRLKNHKEFRGIFGIKVPEPHKDGVPHLHFVVWVAPYYERRTRGGHAVRRSSASLIRRLLREIMHEYSGHDDAYKKHGGKIKIIEKDDASKASPASYVMKYITKSLLVPEASSMDIRDDGVRYLAQMSAIGMRSFSFLGLRGVRGIYDRLYRMADREREALPDGAGWRVIADIVADSRDLWEKSVEKHGFERDEARAEP